MTEHGGPPPEHTPTQGGWLDLDLGLGHHGPEPLPVLRRRLLVAGLVLLVLGVALTAVVATPRGLAAVQRVDENFRELMASHRWPPLVTVSKALSLGFGVLVLWPIRALATLVIALRRHWLALGAWVCTVALSELVIGPVKTLVDRPRPPGPLIATSGASYPSGHAIASAVTAIGVVMALTSGRRRLHWMVAAVCIATVVALSRTYLSAHWLSDVIGGSLIGAGIALAVPEAFEVVRDRRRAVSAAPEPPPAG
ncbi:MAG: phosphatase PAP2 family protein [Mycobacteriales bacterium]